MSQAAAAPTWVRRLGGRRVLALLVVALLASEVVLGQMAVRFSAPGSDVAAYWPNSGISVVALILSSRRWRPATLGGVVVVTVLANLLGGRDLQVSAGYALANAAEAGLALWLLTQAREEQPHGATPTRAPRPGDAPTAPVDGYDDRPRLESVEDFIRLFVACAFASALGAVLAGATIGLLQDGDGLATGRAVLASHLASMLLIVPLSMRLPRDRQHSAGPLEVAAQWATLTMVVAAVFFGQQTLPLVFIIYPVLVWGALRAEPWVTALQLLVAGGTVAVLTTTRGGPYLDTILMTGQPPELVGTLLQAHLLASALVTLPLALIKAQRVLALAEVTRSHEELDAILAATTATAIVGIGLDGSVEYVNVGAERLTGYDAASLLGRATVVLATDTAGAPDTEPVIAFSTAPEADAAPLHGVLEPLLAASEGPHVRDWGFVRADGARLTASVALSRRYAADGRPAGYLAVAEDVTERRRQERAVQEALASEKLAVDRLAQLDQTKNDFLSTVSHELRTPITSILGYSQLLLGQDATDLPPIQRQVVGRIERNGRRLMGLIEDMLAMSQIEVGSFGFTRVPLDAREPLALALDSTLPLLPARDLVLDERIAEEAVLVAGDADKLERAFENLLSNAVKFSNPGEQIVVSLAAEGGEAVFSVTDTGIGIEAEDQAQLFDRFFRGSEAHSQAIQGAGLGLAIAATIVNGHDGRIDVTSTPGRGSTFTIRLPLLEEV